MHASEQILWDENTIATEREEGLKMTQRTQEEPLDERQRFSQVKRSVRFIIFISTLWKNTNLSRHIRGKLCGTKCKIVAVDLTYFS